MEKNRLEAFSDGVMAVIITILVLEIKVPQGNDLAALQPLLPELLDYALTCIYVGIYWNNHHHMMQTVERVNGSVMWSNLLLMFWLSLLPLSTAWMNSSHFARWPVMLYGIDLLACAVSFEILQASLVNLHGSTSLLAQAVGDDLKGKMSLALYVLGLAGTWFRHPMVGITFFGVVAAIWLIPDRRMERALERGPAALPQSPAEDKPSPDMT